MQYSHSVPSPWTPLFVHGLPAAIRSTRGALSRPITLVDRIVEGVARLVISTELRDGDLLPSQDEMARMFGVSRPSLREALHRMEALGVVEAKQGKGTFVRDRSRLTWPAKAVATPDRPAVAELFIAPYDVELAGAVP